MSTSSTTSARYLRPPEPSTLYRCFGNITGAYRIDAVGIRARAVVTNKAPTGLNRGFGGQQLYFGLERLIDEIADDRGLDPAEVRRRNMVSADAFPYATPSGGIYDSGDYARGPRAGARQRRLRATPQGAGRGPREWWTGWGSASRRSSTRRRPTSATSAWPPRFEDRTAKRGKSGSTEHVRVTVDPQGVVTVLLGTVPQGQGHATVARDVVAAHLGLPVEQVRPRGRMDTATTPWTISSGSYSSRFAAAADQRRCSRQPTGSRRPSRWPPRCCCEVDPASLELADGEVRVASDPERSVAFRHAAGLVHWDPGSLPGWLLGTALRGGRVHARRSPRRPHATDQINSSLCYGFVADVVVVRIDQETLTSDD